MPLSRIDFEAWYNDFSPFNLCSWMYVFAFVLAVTSWLCLPQVFGRAAFWLTLLILVVHTFALVARIYISGRPPVTNLYSSAVFIGWAVVAGGLILECLTKLGVGTVVATAAGFLTLRIAHALAADGDTFVVLQAVLDTQFWLATHVVCITLGYATTYLAGLLGVIYLVLGIFTPKLRQNVAQNIARMTYGVLCFALFFSFWGTVLGGLWADDSWGRFWGWDPKENGALIIVLWNALVLHARWDGMVKDRGLAVLAVLGNIVVSWSWFGVNELGIGLHSYGFTEGRLMMLGLFVISVVQGVEPRIPIEPVGREPDRSKGIEQLSRAVTSGPPRRGVRQGLGQLPKVDAVAPWVRPCSLRVLDLAARKRLAHDLGQIAHTVVLVVGADVERLVPDELDRGSQSRPGCPCDISNVHERPPRRTVAHDHDLAGRERPGGEVVQHDVEPKARGDTVGGGVPHEDRREVSVRELGKRLLRPNLRFRVGSQRPQRGVLGHELVRPGGSVHAAGRGEDEPPNARLLRLSGEVNRSPEIDLSRQLFVELAERIVRQRRQMDDPVESLEQVGRDIANVRAKRGEVVHPLEEVAPFIEERVEPGHVVTGFLEHRRRDGADVAVVACDEDFHAWRASALKRGDRVSCGGLLSDGADFPGGA